MRMNTKAIEKINGEMQKNAADKYTEIIGQYIIDRCTNDLDAAKVANEQKSLGGAMKAVMGLASKKKHGNVAVLMPQEVFGEIDKYFGFATDENAQEQAIMAACGAVHMPIKPPAAKKVALNLADFL